MFPQPPRLPNGNTIKEKIQMYGMAGVGKTHQLFQIARWHQDLGSDARFYGLNSDTSWEVLYSNPEFCDLTNIEWKDCNYFQDYVNGAKAAHKKLRAQDWLVLDLSDHAWQAAQDEYARAQAKKYGTNIEDMGDLFAVSDAAEKGKYPIEGWDWGPVNARYRVLANNYMLRGEGHRMVITSQAKVMEPTAQMAAKEDETTKKAREMFRPIGFQPAGQKDDPFRYHTVIHVDGDSRGKVQKMATAKERWGNRQWMGKPVGTNTVRDEPIKDFFTEYLVEKAGWVIQ